MARDSHGSHDGLFEVVDALASLGGSTSVLDPAINLILSSTFESRWVKGFPSVRSCLNKENSPNTTEYRFPK